MKCKILSLGFVLITATLFSNSLSLTKNAGDSKDYPNANYLVMYDSTSVDMQESGLSYNHIHKLIKVLNTNGAKTLNHLKFDYDPLSAFIAIKEVKIHRKNGKTELLNMDDVIDYPAPARAIYWGARQKMIKVGRLETGDAIEYKMFKKGFTYALLYDGEEDDSRYIPPMKGHFYDIIEFWNDEPVLEKVYKVNFPKSKKVRYEFFHGKINVKTKNVEGKVQYLFSMKNLKPIKREPNMVANSDVGPKLLITTSPDWEAKSLWFHGVNEDFGSFESTPEIDKKVSSILKEAKNEMDSISFLNHWVADNIRYSGISMGEGEGFTLHTGDMTFTDRCGVCKDKAGMLITMLRAAGFESYPAMTMAGSRIEDIPADQFNHSVTLVKLSNGEYKLLDPTWIPFSREEWSSREQQQNYLMGVPEGADLMITPISDPKNHPLIIHGTSKILENGTLEGAITIDTEGQSDASIRGLFTRNWKTDWKQALEKEIKSLAHDMELIEMEYNDPYGHMKEPMKISFKYRIPNYATVTENEIIFTPLVASNVFRRAQAHLNADIKAKEKKYGFRDGCSRLVELKETITLPACKKATYLPESENHDGNAASFAGKYTFDNNKLVLEEKITIKKRIFKAEDWENYRTVVTAQKKFAEEKVILSR